MILSQAGHVKITKPNYNLCDTLHVTKEEVDISTKAILAADATAILYALCKAYGSEFAMQTWTAAAENVIDELKGELNNDN